MTSETGSDRGVVQRASDAIAAILGGGTPRDTHERAFIDSLPHALVVADARGAIVETNAAADEMLGYSAGELVGQSIELLVPDDVRVGHAHLRADLTASGEARMLGRGRVLRARRKDGSTLAVMIGVGRWNSKDGLRFVACFTDDEARAHAQADADRERRAASEASELSSAIVRDAPIGILLYNAATGRCVSANAAASTITGVPMETLLEQRFRGITSWKESGLLEAADEALASGTRTTRDLQMTTTAGKVVELHCDLLVTTLRDQPHLVLMMNDLTERRQLEAQLRVAQKMEAIGQLAGGVAHDFNNLLTVIGTYSSLMLEETLPGDPHREDLEEIFSAAKRAATLTRQLLAFGRRQLLDERVLDVNDVIAGLEKILRRVLSAEIEFEIRPGNDLGTIHADAGQVEQAIMNLVVNARDAMPHGGRLTIETVNSTIPADATGDPPREMVTIRVADTGSGMDEATIARIFEPFFTTKDPGRGTGLGLSTTYGIVKQSNGAIRVNSTPGQGTTFELHFPHAHGEAAARQILHTGEARIPGRGDIVVVEDDLTVRRIVVMTLTGIGYKVEEAADGVEAFDLMARRSTAPDLLITDIIMPRMNGRDLVSKARERWPKLKVLFTSAYALDETTGAAAADLPGVLLRKPFIPAELGGAVREAMGVRVG